MFGQPVGGLGDEAAGLEIGKNSGGWCVHGCCYRLLAMKTQDKKLYRAVGLMSGTSLDGVDAVLVETDGEGHVALLGHGYVGYPEELRARVSALAKGDVPLDEVLRVEQALTKLYVQAVESLNVDLTTVDVIGCHGQTIRHLPDEGLTWQLGDIHLLAERTGVPVVGDFRRRDMAAGGQGAPLVPLFHREVLRGAKIGRPCALVNLGGVANVTYFGADEEDIRAADCGPGMGLVDAVMHKRLGEPFDKGGARALEGNPDTKIVTLALEHPFFHKPLPRSADRYEFASLLELVGELPINDALATLCCITAAGVSQTLGMMLEMRNPKVDVVLVGGGAHNMAVHLAMMTMGLTPMMGDKVGLRGATMEAECFAWLAVRRLRGVPFSLPATTGCAHGTVGGSLTAL